MRKTLMTWSALRKGWMKNYRGRMHGISCRQLGVDATKEASWQAANQWWENKRSELDAKIAPPPAPLPVRRWEQIAEWCEVNGQADNAALYRQTAANPEEAQKQWDGMGDMARVVWLDRIKTSGILFKSEQLRQPKTTTGLDKLVTQFLDYKKAKAQSGQLSLGRWDNCRRYLTHWQQWIGIVDPAGLDGVQLEQYHLHLLERIAAKKYSTETAKSNLSVVKEFYRWLCHQDILEHLPKNLDNMTITVEKHKVKTLSIDYIKMTLGGATDREKLYLLLMLNCGFTQVDVAKLAQEDVNWDRGVIVRKRSKTQKHEGVPTVEYPLWPETLRLLKKFHNENGPTVLTNEDGGCLKSERIKADGRYTKVDNIAVAYYRLCKRIKITQQPVKLIRKTSATLLRYSKQYSQFAMLFLGESPRGIAEIHYYGDAPTTFGEAIRWLGQQYGF